LTAVPASRHRIIEILIWESLLSTGPSKLVSLDELSKLIREGLFVSQLHLGASCSRTWEVSSTCHVEVRVIFAGGR
jgi:hypothetical protein